MSANESGDDILSGVAADIAHQISGRAEDYVNDPNVEMMWAIRAHKFASTHMKLLGTEDTVKLRLTRHDEEILAAFNDEFVGFELDVVSEESLKSARAKEVGIKGLFSEVSVPLQQWRAFIEKFKHVNNYDFGTLLRLDASKPYDSENTILVNRIQFYAIEVARNKAGINARHRDNFVEYLQEAETHE